MAYIVYIRLSDVLILLVTFKSACKGILYNLALLHHIGIFFEGT